MWKYLILFVLLSVKSLSQPIFVQNTNSHSNNFLDFKEWLFYTENEILWQINDSQKTIVKNDLDSAFNFVKTDHYLFFLDKNGLWYTNGDYTINYAGDYTAFSNPAKLNNEIIFWAQHRNSSGIELYKLKPDGTTEPVKDINPGAASSFVNNNVSKLKILDSLAYFVAYDQIHGSELWKTNGTTEKTELVYEFNQDSLVQWQTTFLTYNNELYFFTDSANSYTLWKCNPSIGVIPLKTFKPNGITNPKYRHGSINYIDNLIYFDIARDSGISKIIEFWNYDPVSEDFIFLKSVNYDYHLFDGFIWPSLTQKNNQLLYLHRLDYDSHKIWSVNGKNKSVTNIIYLNCCPEYFMEEFYTIGSYPVIHYHIEQGRALLEKINPDGSRNGIMTFYRERPIIQHKVNSDRYFFYRDYEDMEKSYLAEDGLNIPLHLILYDLKTDTKVLLKDKYPGNGAVFVDEKNLTMVGETLYFTSENKLYRFDLSPSIVSGIQNNSYNSFTAFPNPVNDVLTVRIEEELVSNTSLEIINLHGNLIKTVRLSENTTEHKIDLSDLFPGLYYLNMESTGRVMSLIKR